MAITVSGTTLTFNDATTQTTAGLTGSSDQLAKAWVNWNGSSGAIYSSYGISSVTVNTTGQYTINYTNAFANTNYCCQLTTTSNPGINRTGSLNYASLAGSQASAPTTTSVTVCASASNGNFNPVYCMATFWA